MSDDRPEVADAQPGNKNDPQAPADRADGEGPPKWDVFTDRGVMPRGLTNGAAAALDLAEEARKDAYAERPGRMSYLEHGVDQVAQRLGADAASSLFFNDSNVVRKTLVAAVPETARMGSFFIPGAKGVAATIGLSMAAQMSPQDTPMTQATDGLFGAARGGFERGVVKTMGLAAADAPLKFRTEASVLCGGLGSVAFRGIETMTSRSAYTDLNGNIDLRDGIPRALGEFADPRLMIADTAVALALNFRMGRMGTGNLMLRQAGISGLVGAYTGANAEMVQQAKDGNGLDFDYTQIAKQGAFSAAKYAAIGTVQAKSAAGSYKQADNYLLRIRP